MDTETVQKLCELNQQFYERFADSFSKTRDQPWEGWTRVLERLEQRSRDRLSVLDLGCGNGRFGRFLYQKSTRPIQYLGLDQSAALLNHARKQLAPWPQARFEQAELALHPPKIEQRFDLVALFGLLHHLPGKQTRRQLIGQAQRYVRPGGLLALTVWQFAQRPRFARKLVPWSELNRYTDRVVATEQLETGDYLLRWGTGEEAVRYCHHCSDDELAQLLGTVALELVDEFRADGRSHDLNRYVVLSA